MTRDSVQDVVWKLVEEAHSYDMTPQQVNRELKIAWIELNRQQFEEEKRYAEKWFKTRHVR